MHPGGVKHAETAISSTVARPFGPYWVGHVNATLTESRPSNRSTKGRQQRKPFALPLRWLQTVHSDTHEHMEGRRVPGSQSHQSVLCSGRPLAGRNSRAGDGLPLLWVR